MTKQSLAALAAVFTTFPVPNNTYHGPRTKKQKQEKQITDIDLNKIEKAKVKRSRKNRVRLSTN